MLVFVLLWSQAMATFTIFYRSLLFIVEAKVGRENKRRKIGYVNEQPFLTDRGCHIQRISLVVACCMPDNDMGTMCIDQIFFNVPYRSLLILSRDQNTGQEGHNICFFLLALSICNNPSNLYDTISQSSIQTNTHKNIGRQYRHRQHPAGILLSTDLRVAQMMNTELREEDDEKTAKGLKYDRNMTALGKNFQCVRRSPGNILQVSDIHVEWRSKHYHSLIIIHCSIDGD